MSHTNLYGFFTEFPWSREAWQETENNTHNNTWSKIFENFHGAENNTHNNTQNTKQAAPMQTKTQNNTQYIISNGKEEQASQEEEDSLTSKTGEEETATARKKSQHRRRRRGRNRQWRGRRRKKKRRQCGWGEEFSEEEAFSRRKKKKHFWEWTVTHTVESLCRFYIKRWRAFSPFYPRCWVPQAIAAKQTSFLWAHLHRLFDPLDLHEEILKTFTTNYRSLYSHFPRLNTRISRTQRCT